MSGYSSTVRPHWQKKRREDKFTFAKEIVRSGDYILQHMKEDLHVERKSSYRFATKLDKEVQALLIEKIRSRYPDDCFVQKKKDVCAMLGQGSVYYRSY